MSARSDDWLELRDGWTNPYVTQSSKDFGDDLRVSVPSAGNTDLERNCRSDAGGHRCRRNMVRQDDQ